MGTAAALLSLAPFVQIFFLAWMFGAGWMSVRAYARRTGTWLTGGMGARLGAATGAIAAVIYNVMLVLAIRLGDYGAVLRAELERQINTISATASAEDAARLREIFLSPDGLAIIVTATVALMFALFVLLALLGGMLGAHASRRQSRT